MTDVIQANESNEENENENKVLGEIGDSSVNVEDKVDSANNGEENEKSVTTDEASSNLIPETTNVDKEISCTNEAETTGKEKENGSKEESSDEDIDNEDDDDDNDDGEENEAAMETDDDDAEEEDGNSSESVEEEETQVENKKQSKKEKGKKKEEEIPVRKKIGPQKQKKDIHSYLKKAKKFEIQKLTRRIAVLRNLKGNEQQKAKNIRKADKLVLEIQAMKDFMIDQLTERVVNIFKGTAEKTYMDIWNAAQTPKEFETMLQVFSNGDDDDKFEKISFLRMLASKDILSKFKMIHSGINISKPKSKKALQKQLRKYNQKMKKTRKAEQKAMEKPEEEDNVDKEDNNTKSDTPKNEEEQPKKKRQKTEKKKVKQKKQKQNKDSFFLSADNAEESDKNEDMSSDEEFSAPVNPSQIPTKKKNRMGQRARKKLLENENMKKAGKFKDDRKDNSRNRKMNRTKPIDKNKSNKNLNKFVDKKNKTVTKLVNKVKDDVNVHPSWVAKQKLKSQQGITEFSGTKITFDD